MITASESQWQQILDRERVSKYLPYVDYEDDVYITSDEGVGFILESEPLTFANDKVHDAIESALSMLPDAVDMQFILYASPDVTHKIDEWRSNKKRVESLCGEIVENYSNFLEQKAVSYITPNFYCPVRNFKLYVTIKYGGSSGKKSLIDSIKDFSTVGISLKSLLKKDDHKSEMYYKKVDEKLQKLFHFKERFQGALSSAGFMFKYATPDDLIRLYYPLFNQYKDQREKPKWDGSDINNYLFANDNSVKISKESIEVGGTHIKTMACKDYPRKWNLAYNTQFVGSILEKVNHSSSFMMTLNITKLKEGEKDKIKMRATATNSQRMPYTLFPKLKTIHEDLAYGMEKIENGSNPFYLTFQIAVFGSSKNAVEKASGEMQSYFKARKFVLESDLYVNFPALISMLPFGYNNDLQHFLGPERGRIVFGENVADLPPVAADWKGIKNEIPLISPRGQLFGLDLFGNNAGGYNAFCVGTTGSGKSVWLQYIATNYYMAGDKIWVIDIGRSYERFAHAFGGQFIELDREKPMSLNPFTNIKNEKDLEEYKEFLQDLFLLLGLPKEVQLSEQLEKLMKSYLEEAILKSYSKHKHESDIDTVVVELEKIAEKIQDTRLIDFVRTLMPYRKGRQYEDFFNGKSEINFSADIVVLECDQLEKMPDLLNPVLMLLSFQISKEIYMEEKTKQKENRHIVIMDEAHKFLKSGHVELFVEQAYRRFRKHGASMILGTQGFEDFYGGEKISSVGRVIVQNSYWNFFMMQKSTSIKAIQKSDYFDFSEYENKLMEGIQPVDKEYGEVFIVTDSVKTVGRIVLDNFLMNMYFTTKELRVRINQLVQQGYSYTEAIGIAQRKNPRVQINGSLRVKIEDLVNNSKDVIKVELLDISESGAGLMLPIGQEQKVDNISSIYHPRTGQEISVQVRKKVPMQKGGMKVGVEFMTCNLKIEEFKNE